MTKKKEDAMKNFFKKRQTRTTRYSDGRRPHLTGIGDAGGLVLEESTSEEELPPPPPAPHRAAFASILEEARTGSKDAKPAQPKKKKDQAAKGQTAQPDRVVRKSQLLSQTVPPGLVREDEYEEELKRRETGIKGARIGVSTAVPMCEKEHVRLICHWSYSDPTNRKGTWRLEQVDHRNYLNNGFEDHQKCKCRKNTDLLDELAWRMIRDFEQHEDKEYNMEEKKEKERIERAEGRIKKRIPPHVQMVRELSSLVVYAMHGTSITHNAGGTGEKGTGDRKDKGDKDEKGKKSRKDDKDIVMKRKEAQKAAEVARLRRLMEDKAQRKVADQQRIERRANERTDAQRMANGADLVNDPVLRRPVGSDQAGGSRTTTKQQSQEPENHPEKDDLTSKENKARNQLEKKGKQARPKKPAQPGLTEEEQKALQSIQAAEQEEIDRLDQAERDDEERQRQLVAQQEESGGAFEQEDDSDDELEAAMLDALEHASPEPEPAKGQPAKNSQKKTADPKLSKAESAPDEPQAPSPPPRERKRRPKPRARPVVEDSSEESDSANAPKYTNIAKPKPKVSPKIRKPTVSFAEYVVAKAAGKTPTSGIEQPEKSDKAEKTSEAFEKPVTNATTKAETKKGEKLKSEEFIPDSDLENDTKDDVELPSDKLDNEQVSAEITNTDMTIISAEQDDNIVEVTVETTTLAVEVQQQDGSTERTEITETTTLSNNPPGQGQVTVEQATHLQAVTALGVPEQERPRGSPPSPEHELAPGFTTPTNASGIDTAISTPQLSSPTESHSSGTSPRKRKHSTPPPAPQHKPSPEFEDAHTPSPPKKRKTTPPADADSGEPGTPPVLGNIDYTPESASRTRDSPPVSPGAVSVASSTSSSSRKRKYIWSEENGEVTVSPGGTKKVRRVQTTGGTLVQGGAEEIGESEGRETEGSEKAQKEGEAPAQDAESAEAEGRDSDDLDSLFEE